MPVSQPYRISWDHATSLETINARLSEQLGRIDAMFEELYRTLQRLPTDYIENGTWTPIIGGLDSTGTDQQYSIQTGRYIKIGKVVVAICRVALSSKGTITGNIAINGLPYPGEGSLYVAENQNKFSAVSISYFSGLATNWISITGHIRPGETRILLLGRQSAGTASTNLTPSDIGNTTEFILTAVYLAS